MHDLRDFNVIHLCDLENSERITKRRIKRQWGNRCAYCGIAPSPGNPLTIDHIVPISKGGNILAVYNRIPACLQCNQAKKHQDLEEWLFRQPFFNAFMYRRILRWMFPKLNDATINLILLQNCRAKRVFLS